MPIDQASYEINDYIAIWLIDVIGLYIAKVIDRKPLRVKVAEVGALSSLKENGFKIRTEETVILQQDIREATWNFVYKYPAAISALEIFGSKDGEFIGISRQIIQKMHQSGNIET